jgi:hypothetical protein
MNINDKNDEIKCNHIINLGMLFRSVLTIICFTILYMNLNKKYLYLILPFLFYILDISDNFLHGTICCKYFKYQSTDKTIDILSYFILFLIIKNDRLLYFFIIYRFIGVIFFLITKNSYSLVFFFDFIKEYLLYIFIFGYNYNYIYIFIILKIILEYFLHIIHNNVNYNYPKDNNKNVELNEFLNKYIFL